MPKQKAISPKQIAFLFKYLDATKPAWKCYQEVYGCTESTAKRKGYALLNNHFVKSFMDDRVNNQLHMYSGRAAEALGEALESPDVNARIRAANSILDRTGHGKTGADEAGQVEVKLHFHGLSEDDFPDVES